MPIAHVRVLAVAQVGSDFLREKAKARCAAPIPGRLRIDCQLRLLILRFTGLPSGTEVPAVGFWLTMLQAGMVCGAPTVEVISNLPSGSIWPYHYFPRYKSITTSPLGWEQQISRLPWAGGSSGLGW
jgi:hypothetical protein